MVSADIVAPRRPELGFTRAFLNRDPDRHVFQVIEE
jgi:hypothetical protein